jgi:hypothetical protein
MPTIGCVLIFLTNVQKIKSTRTLHSQALWLIWPKNKKSEVIYLGGSSTAEKTCKDQGKLRKQL